MYIVQTCKVQNVVLARHLKRHFASGVSLIGCLNVVTVHRALSFGTLLFSGEIFLLYFCLFKCWHQQDQELTLCLNLCHFPELPSNSHTALWLRWRDWTPTVTWAVLKRKKKCLTLPIFLFSPHLTPMPMAYCNCLKDTWFYWSWIPFKQCPLKNLQGHTR